MMRSTSSPPLRKPLLSRNERRAETALQEIAQRHGFRVFSQVKLSQAIDPPDGLKKSQWDYATRATFDFVVCDAETLIPEFAVELDDATHREPRTRDGSLGTSIAGVPDRGEGVHPNGGRAASARLSPARRAL